MSVAVSVIVPVFNPGRAFEACVASLLGQTMPPGELELIFVDDGSTDGTEARLDALAAEHDHVRVEHIPNSGWPGRPRNLGMDMARGEFVYFVDNDDRLERDGIARVHAAALADGADIVIGKVVGHGKRVPRELFRRSRRAEPFDSPVLLGLLTPHKLFRRAMLAEHRIRFPEGRRRLEDHLFVVHAYLHAQGISVLADRPVYHWMLHDHGDHASYRRLEPDGYFGNVREVLDLVVEHTEPGAFRESLLAHWYRGKMLGRVGGPAFSRRDGAYGRRLTETIRELALERYDERAHERLAFNLQVRSRLLRAGDFDALHRLAEFESGLRARLRASVDGDGEQLALRLTAKLGSPGELRFTREGDTVRWRPPPPLREVLAAADLDATEALRGSRIQVYLHSLRDGSEYLLPSTTEVSLDAEPGRPVLSARVEIEAARAAAGAPLPTGDWEVRAVVSVAGFSQARSVRRGGAPLVLRASAPGRLVARRAFVRMAARRLSATRRVLSPSL
jgi:glycosyltransferase involved in cell wall biosynthesis